MTQRAEGEENLGEVPDEVAGGTTSQPRLVTPDLLRAWHLPEPSGTKYSRGQVLVVGGAVHTPGAAMLAGVSALRMGAGRLSLGVAEGVAAQVAVAIPECGTTGLPQDDAGAVTGHRAGELLRSEVERADAIVIGPGLDDPEGAARLLAEIGGVLPDDTPVVLDAFAATSLPDLDQDTLKTYAGRLVLTPNVGELARLIDDDSLPDRGDEALPAAVLQAAATFGAVVACENWVGHDGALWLLTTGDTGLGTSGSGDVVAGAVGGLLSRGAALAQAVCWGKYVHAAAGDALAARYGRIGFLAGELPGELPLIMRTLRGD